MKNDLNYKSEIEKFEKIVFVNGVTEKGVKLLQDHNKKSIKFETKNNFFYRSLSETIKNIQLLLNPLLGKSFIKFLNHILILTKLLLYIMSFIMSVFIEKYVIRQ